MIRIKPLPKGSGFQFEDATKGGVLPKQFISSIKEGIAESMQSGILAGYPMVDIKVILLDGKSHEVDSTELAYRIAGSLAFQNAAAKATPVLLEPVMDVEITVPEDNLGDVINDLNSRRGNILGISPKGNVQSVRVIVPLSEMFGYATRVRSLSQGRAVFTMEFNHYEQVPESLFKSLMSKLRGF
jgi:elongation factor G